MIELSESQFETRTGDGAQQALDFVNESIAGNPAVFQYIKTINNSYIYTIEWFVGGRVFILTTSNFSKQETLIIAGEISTKFLQMSNDGWGSQYTLQASSIPPRDASQQ